MVKVSIAAGVALFAGLLIAEHLSQPLFSRLSPGQIRLSVAACGNQVSQETQDYCTADTARSCAQDTSFVTLTCTGGTSSQYNVKTGCQFASEFNACTKHAGAKLATEAGNYKLVDGTPGSCGAWSGNLCKTTATPKTWACGHAGHNGKTVTFNEQICSSDPNNPIGQNCQGVTKVAGGC